MGNKKTELRFIHDWLRSWTGGVPDKLLGYYSNDAYYSDPANQAGIRGIENLRPYLTKLLAKNPNWIWSAEEIIPTEKGCTLKWKALIPVGNGSIELCGLDIIEITAGKISRNEVYFDRVPWEEAKTELENSFK